MVPSLLSACHFRRRTANSVKRDCGLELQVAVQKFAVAWEKLRKCQCPRIFIIERHYKWNISELCLGSLLLPTLRAPLLRPAAPGT